MIGVPFDNNDLMCLGSISEIVADLVENRDPLLTELAAQHPTTEALAVWISSLPQRNDETDPNDGPKVDACLPPQRLRIPAPDPNCVERAALYLGVAELIDPVPMRQLATLDFDWGRHTFPLEYGSPIILDPSVPAEDIVHAVASGALGEPHTAAPPKRSALQPVTIDVTEAIEYTAELAAVGASATRNGPNRARLARNALRSFLQTGTPPSDDRTVDAIGWFFAQAEQVARSYGARALNIVRKTARAISDLVDDVLAERQQRHHEQARNLSFSLNGTTYEMPSWLSGLGSLVGRVGADVGAIYLAPKLAAMGITGQMLQLVEEELNHDGLTLGPLAKPGTSMASALGALAAKRAS
jgi:hypothetical protein